MARYYPSAEDLTTVANLLRCTEIDCSSVFKSESNLNLHLAKHHKKEELAGLLMKQQEPNREYYCPEPSCIYNSSKFFKTIKLLKQHYLKVHGRKDFLCNKCQKGFPTESACNYHFEYCGVNFTCCECEVTYTCYDTLTTHARRKKHKIMPKINYKHYGTETEITFEITELEPLLLPCPVPLANLFLLMHKTDQSSQTDLEERTRKSIKRNHSIETQTSKSKYPQSCAETQTIGDYICQNSTSSLSSSSTESLNRKSIKTQTAAVVSTTKSCNTAFNANTLNFDVEKSTLGTQTLMNLFNQDFEFMNSSCQTSFTDSLEFDSRNYYNTETQTDFLHSDFDILAGDICSNMCTQTCDVVDMKFNNNYTQTVMDDMLKSVGSQTIMSLNTICNRDMAHNETQTDTIFKQMLEEINA